MRELKDLEVRQFRREDIDLFVEQYGLDPDLQKYVELWKETYATMGPGASIFDGEKLIFSIGATQFWPGTAEGWIMLPPNLNGYVRELYYYSKMYTDEVIKHWGFKRLQAKVKASFVGGQHFCERLGMKREALMKKMGPGYEDYYLYARVE